MVDGRGRWDFLVTYTQADRSWAEWIGWQLEQDGYSVRVQGWDMPDGVDRLRLMTEEIDKCDHAVAVLSEAYVRSVAGRPEWQEAFRRDPSGVARKLVPVRVRECARPGILGTAVCFDLFGLGPVQARERLLDQVRVLRAGRPRSLAPATRFGGAAAPVTAALERPAPVAGAPDPLPAPRPRVEHEGDLDTTWPATLTVSFSGDGRLLAAGGLGRSVQLWTPAPQGPPTSVGALAHHAGPAAEAVGAVAFSPDSGWLASGGSDRAVSVWSPAGGGERLARIQDFGGPVVDLAFSPRSRLLAVASDQDAVEVWDLHALANGGGGPGRTGLLPTDDLARAVGFSASGRLLATGCDDGTVSTWDLAGPRKLAQFRAHRGRVQSLAFSPREAYLVSAGNDATAKVWDVRDPAEPGGSVVLTDHFGPVRATAFSHDGRLLATAGADRTVRVWDLSAGAARPSRYASFTGHRGGANTVSFSPSGTHLAVGTGSRLTRIWRLAEA